LAIRLDGENTLLKEERIKTLILAFWLPKKFYLDENPSNKGRFFNSMEEG
jgi:hypothetical protein